MIRRAVAEHQVADDDQALDDHPEWDAEEHAFAAAWRNQPKWVVSRSLKSVGPNARLVEDDLEGAIRDYNVTFMGPTMAGGVRA